MMPWIRSVEFPHFEVQSIDAIPSINSEMKIDHCTDMHGAHMEIITPWNEINFIGMFFEGVISISLYTVDCEKSSRYTPR